MDPIDTDVDRNWSYTLVKPNWYSTWGSREDWRAHTCTWVRDEEVLIGVHACPSATSGGMVHEIWCWDSVWHLCVLSHLCFTYVYCVWQLRVYLIWLEQHQEGSLLPHSPFHSLIIPCAASGLSVSLCIICLWLSNPTHPATHSLFLWLLQWALFSSTGYEPHSALAVKSWT